jgi:hypothetical protein
MVCSAAGTLDIVIVSYNCEALLADALDSLDVVEDVTVRVIVVDNASSDGTKEMLGSRYPRVNSVFLTKNVGFSAANNVGLRECRGDFVLLLNPDTVVPPRGLAGALEQLANSPEIGMLGCKLIRPDGTLDHACKRGFPTPLGALLYFLKLPRAFSRLSVATSYVAAKQPDDEPGLVDAINGAFMLVRQSAVRVVGPLDERFWMYGEDLDWCYRFWRAGWSILYWPDLIVTHVKGGSSSSLRAWRVNKAFHESMWLFYAKHYASRRARLSRGIIWCAIYGKLVVSGLRSWTLRSWAARAESITMSPRSANADR